MSGEAFKHPEVILMQALARRIIDPMASFNGRGDDSLAIGGRI